MFLKEKLVSELAANVTCRATFLWTPLLVIFYDDRLRFSYYKSVREKLRLIKITKVSQKENKVAESLISESKVKDCKNESKVVENKDILENMICKNETEVGEKIKNEKMVEENKLILGETIIIDENMAETKL